MGKIKTKSDIPGTGNYYVSTIFLNPKQPIDLTDIPMLAVS